MIQQRYHGYIALTSVILISAILMVMMAPFAFSSVTTRVSGVTQADRERSRAVARGCMEYALLELSLNSAYTGSETRTVPSGATQESCTIETITYDGTNKLIPVRATVGQSTTNIHLTVNATTLTRVSYAEVPAL